MCQYPCLSHLCHTLLLYIHCYTRSMPCPGPTLYIFHVCSETGCTGLLCPDPAHHRAHQQSRAGSGRNRSTSLLAGRYHGCTCRMEEGKILTQSNPAIIRLHLKHIIDLLVAITGVADLLVTHSSRPARVTSTSEATVTSRVAFTLDTGASLTGLAAWLHPVAQPLSGGAL